MRNPERINNILKLIQEIWEAHPDLRLCQLIGNCFWHKHDLYYVEDEELEKRLNEVYKISVGSKK